MFTMSLYAKHVMGDQSFNYNTAPVVERGRIQKLMENYVHIPPHPLLNYSIFRDCERYITNRNQFLGLYRLGGIS